MLASCAQRVEADQERGEDRAVAQQDAERPGEGVGQREDVQEQRSHHDEADRRERSVVVVSAGWLKVLVGWPPGPKT